MTQEEANKLILEHCSKEGIAKGWVEEHIKYNAIKEENESLNKDRKKLIRSNTKLREEKIRLNNIINKAIEEIYYLESNCDITEFASIKLRQILKGE